MVGQSIMSVELVQQQKKKSSMSVLDQLKAAKTIIVADTGDFEGNRFHYITWGCKIKTMLKLKHQSFL